MGRYVRGPPIRSRSLAEIYSKAGSGEYRTKPTDQYGKFPARYEPVAEQKIGRPPAEGRAEYKIFHHHEKWGSPDRHDIAKREGERKDAQILRQEKEIDGLRWEKAERYNDDKLLKELFREKAENYSNRLRQERGRAERVQGGPL